MKFRLVKTLVFETEAHDKYEADILFRQMEADNRFAAKVDRNIENCDAEKG